MDEDLCDLGLGMKMGDVAIIPGVDVNMLTAVLEGILEKHEEDAKKRWREDAALFHSTTDWEGLSCCTTETDSAVCVVME